jgi:hypothetical protein
VTHRSNFLKLSEHITMAEVAGTALDPKGCDFVLNRGHVPILEFNADGTSYWHASMLFLRSRGVNQTDVPTGR